SSRFSSRPGLCSFSTDIAAPMVSWVSSSCFMSRFFTTDGTDNTDFFLSLSAPIREIRGLIPFIPLRDLDLSDERNVEDFDPVASVRINGQKSPVGRDAGVIGSGNRVAAAVGQAHRKWPERSGGHSLFYRFLCHVSCIRGLIRLFPYRSERFNVLTLPRFNALARHLDPAFAVVLE